MLVRKLLFVIIYFPNHASNIYDTSRKTGCVLLIKLVTDVIELQRPSHSSLAIVALTNFFFLILYRKFSVSKTSTKHPQKKSSTLLIAYTINEATYNTHVQYTQTDTNRQNALTNRTIGKRLRFVKDALRFVPLERMVSSSFDRNSIGEMHLINTCKPCKNEWSIGTIGTNGKVVSRLVTIRTIGTNGKLLSRSVYHL